MDYIKWLFFMPLQKLFPQGRGCSEHVLAVRHVKRKQAGNTGDALVIDPVYGNRVQDNRFRLAARQRHNFYIVSQLLEPMGEMVGKTCYASKTTVRRVFS